jgi:hypothetical protein
MKNVIFFLALTIFLTEQSMTMFKRDSQIHTTSNALADNFKIVNEIRAVAATNIKLRNAYHQFGADSPQAQTALEENEKMVYQLYKKKEELAAKKIIPGKNHCCTIS